MQRKYMYVFSVQIVGCKTHLQTLSSCQAKEKTKKIATETMLPITFKMSRISGENYIF